ncbi:MAG TPA: DUF4292 domain-containing protein [Chitinophagaceae bacterium]|jgi:hypothetical protein|nr:DUF4292 domain-containing protein [Chitinophagaceae bacterium]
MKSSLTAFIGFICLFCSCRSTKKIQTAVAKKDTAAIVMSLPPDHGKEDSIAFIKEIFQGIGKNYIDFTTFSGKIDLDYEDADGKKYNVNAHVRMYKDSVIWISITAILGIEGLRVLITPDSVKLLDKQNKIYMPRSVSFLQEVTALPLDLATLQDLLLGNPVFLDSNIISYSRSGNTISLQSNGTFFKNLFTIGESDKLVQTSKLDDIDMLRSRTCYLTYSDYEDKKGPDGYRVNFSTKRTIHVAEKKKLDIKMDFKQIDFNEKLSFPFSVPKNYEQN